MAERSRTRGWPGVAAPLVCATSLSALSALSWAQPVPASLRSCAREADATRRLACYDTQMTRLGEPAPPSSAQDHQPVAAQPPAEKSPAVASSSTSSSAQAQPGMLERARGMIGKPAGQQPTAVSAHLLSIEGQPNDMILHLDNGQVWQQMEGASGALSLRAGDAVTIQSHWGSYWLSSDHVSSMRVRQK